MFPAILSLLIVGQALADEVTDDKKIYFTGAEVASSSAERIIHSIELPNGVYITTGDINGTSYPNTDKLIKAVFAERGFKLSDRLEGSSIMIEFDFNGKINMGKVEEQASKLPLLTAGSGEVNPKASADPALQNSAKLTYGSVLLGGAISGNAMQRGMGASGLIAAFVPASVHAHDMTVEVAAHIWPKPELSKGFFGNDIVKETPDSKINHTAIYYYAPKVGYVFIPPETMMTILVTAVNQWIDRYMVLDAGPVAVSAVAATLTLADAKK